jgi:ATP-dependent RNA helicase RhlE
MAFSALGLSAPLLKAIGEQSFTQPTPVQQQAIPAILQGKDILGISKTGSGKTAGYVLPTGIVPAPGRKERQARAGTGNSAHP